MLRSVLSRLPFGGGPDPERESGDDTEGGFRPSELDASVLYAHGKDVERLEAEIADVEEQAAELEAVRRDR